MITVGAVVGSTRPGRRARGVADWVLETAVIEPIDAFVLVTPEYNHGTSAVLKNALDFLYAEWNNKAVGFVSYGSAGGARAVEQLRTMLDQVVAWGTALATVRRG